MKFRSVAVFSCLALSVPLACDSGSTPDPTASGGSAAGGTAAGGGTTTGGNGPCTGAACTGGSAPGGQGGQGEGGQADLGGQGGQGGDATGGTDPGGCHPKATLVLQRSGAMFEFPDGDTKWWDAVAEALDSDADDLLDKYSGQLDLGVTTFYMSEEKDSCLLGDSTKPALKPNGLSKFLSDQADDHESLVDDEVKVDAPLEAALDAAAAKLGSDGDRYIVLAVSGNPDTCSSRDGQCDTIGAVEKVRELRMAGIHTKVLFLHSTEIDGYAQGLANAAAGRGVKDFVGSMCDTDFNFANNPMNAEYGHPDNVDAVEGALDALLSEVANCK